MVSKKEPLVAQTRLQIDNGVARCIRRDAFQENGDADASLGVPVSLQMSNPTIYGEVGMTKKKWDFFPPHPGDGVTLHQ